MVEPSPRHPVYTRNVVLLAIIQAAGKQLAFAKKAGKPSEVHSGAVAFSHARLPVWRMRKPVLKTSQMSFRST
jgi:hypothetical protein